MKNSMRVVLVAAAALASGCVQSSPLLLLGIFPTEAMAACTPSDTGFQSSAEYSFSSVPSATQVCLGAKNLLAGDLRIEIGGKTLDDPESRNIIFIEEVLHTYSAIITANSKSQSLSLPAETLREGFSVKPDDKAGAFVSLLGDTAAQSLFDGTQVGDRVDVLVTFRLRGRINSGGSITSQPFTWPVRYTRQ